MSLLSASMQRKIYEVGGRLGVADPQWLVKLIKFESKFNPAAKNPGSSARGLIQVIDSTARSVFNADSSVSLISKYPDFNSQMDNVVYPYLAQYKPFPTAQSLYMSVFYPAARNVDPSTTFYTLYQQYAGANWKDRYAKFEATNGGIRKVQDYIDLVEGTFYLKKSAPFIPVLLTVGAVAYAIYRRGGI